MCVCAVFTHTQTLPTVSSTLRQHRVKHKQQPPSVQRLLWETDLASNCNHQPEVTEQNICSTGPQTEPMTCRHLGEKQSFSPATQTLAGASAGGNRTLQMQPVPRRMPGAGYCPEFCEPLFSLLLTLPGETREDVLECRITAEVEKGTKDAQGRGLCFIIVHV